jgi:hypothetical protein
MSLNALRPVTENKTPLKVKMFVSHALEGVEECINEWLAQEAAKICHVTQSQSERQGKFVFVIAVFYEAFR